MPELRVPQVLVDLYHDLDEQHLLPVVAVLIVGIIAIPLLLGGSSASDHGGGASGDGGATASVAPQAKRSSLVVAKATPGLRAYKRRLDHLQPTDPFKPKYAAESDAEAGVSSTESGESSVTTEANTGTGPAESGTGGGSSPESTTGSGKTKVTYFTYAIDVRVVPVSAGDGKPSKAEATARRDLPPLVTLPSRDTPALTYIGPSRDGKKAMMLVSSDVTSLFGDSKCTLGSESCQMLALEPGLPETVVFGPQARTYRIELLKVHVELTDHLERAPLGKPPGRSKAG
jgi:hypothetical protein